MGLLFGLGLCLPVVDIVFRSCEWISFSKVARCRANIGTMIPSAHGQVRHVPTIPTCRSRVQLGNV